MEFLEDAEFWHWWVLGIALVVVEVFAPGTFFLWMGVSAGIVGLVVLAAPALAWEYQFLLFAVFALASAVSWRLYQRGHPTRTDRPTLNRRGEQYVGRTFTLEEPVVNGQGKIHVDDTTWKIEGEDLPVGARVHVTGVEGTVLKVEPA